MSEEQNGRQRIDQGPIAAILALAKARGISKISETEGVFHLPVDEHWNVYVNPHSEPCLHGDAVTILEPTQFLIEFNGWPAALFHPIDETIVFVAGSAANIETFRAAVLAAIALEERTAARPEREGV